jgi:glycine/D-amino acid oxidase-like deaminating enzyme
MTTTTADIAICGAGIAGIATAYTLARRGMQNILLIDERPPLSLTSDKSTECYRDFWPGPGDAMVQLMGRSIDILEELARASGNAFRMNRRGYLYVTRSIAGAERLRQAAEEAAGLGAGPLRVYGGSEPRNRETQNQEPRTQNPEPTSDTRQGDKETRRQGNPSFDEKLPATSHQPPAISHPSSIVHRLQTYTPLDPHDWEGQPRGADFLTDQSLIRQHFPYLGDDVIAVLHARRCGWLSAQQLGMYLLEQARALGVRHITARLDGVELEDGRVAAIRLSGDGAPGRVATPHFVNCAGPLLRVVGQLLGEELPVFSERHVKLAFEDRRGAVPRTAPMVINADPVLLDWSEEERELLAEDPETAQLLGELPAGAHLRPEGEGGSPWVLALWAYDAVPVPEVFPPQLPEQFAEVAMRGVAAIVPALEAYVERPPRPTLDGGYYTKTRENRPLIGPTSMPGSYVLGALSGYGIMAACGAAELLAAHILGENLPGYAGAFLPERYGDPEYQRVLEEWGDTGQL